MNETPKIYVACLAAYNNGHLHGEWIDCDQDAEDIYAEIKEMLKTSPVRHFESCEEWAIHDYENWHEIKLHEYESIEKVAELGQAIKKHGAAIAAYYAHFKSLENFEDYSQGEYESEEDFVKNYLTENGTFEAIEKLGLYTSYIDCEAIARDWFCSDYVSLESDGKTYIFTNH
ncbi:antirestriction protein ArdA [Crocosphaera sp. UHCC 0190]|uniref:antirestriction protein ArdA n=1 Tax=Crocosphaera sp. UHCC 0190 TaxID=3110246 RepID=UPI002B1EF99C|nr:antirestriction protein ArdA [Crocosphaera sp. UHCC 0190]MEA5511788.1 antirestriction protein ArdA [Crocosphaera sp. UHCC 0190]